MGKTFSTFNILVLYSYVLYSMKFGWCAGSACYITVCSSTCNMCDVDNAGRVAARNRVLAEAVPPTEKGIYTFPGEVL